MGVVSGPLMPTRYSRKASTVSSGSQLPNCLKAFSPAKTSIQAIFRRAAVGLRDRGVEDAHAGAPDVGPGAVALDERDDGLVRDLQLAVLDRDLGAVGGHLDVLVGHGKEASFEGTDSSRNQAAPRGFRVTASAGRE